MWLSRAANSFRKTRSTPRWTSDGIPFAETAQLTRRPPAEDDCLTGGSPGHLLECPAAFRVLAAQALAAFALLCVLPAAAEDLKPICSDRPGRGTGACTVEQGHWQVELGLWDGTFQHRDGVTTDVTSAANPAVKYGISDDADIEASMAFYQSVRVHDLSGGQTFKGVGDLFLRAKWNPAGEDGDGEFSWILAPFIKVPTASRGLGNGGVEGGLLLPLSYEFEDGWSLESTPEADILLNRKANGYYADMVDVIGLSRDIAGGFNLGLEIWTNQDLDPGGTTSQYGLGPTLAWQPDPDNQFDGGFLIGLNRQTPELELYVGFSRRF
jgi:hypothetical protein